jgi:hypothetical protein
MSLYTVAIAVHVVVAVLAIGLVGAVPLTARFARQAPHARQRAEPHTDEAVGAFVGSEQVLGALLRAMQVGFLLMVLTGVLLDVSAAGAFHRTAWFKVSMAVLAVIGISQARVRAALRRGFAPGGERELALARVERWGWVMCAAVALITLLMQCKPLP